MRLALSLLLPLVLAGPLVQDEPEPLPEPVAQAVEVLDQAFATRFEPGIMAAIEQARGHEHPEVIRRIAAGLDHFKSGVRRTAVVALAEMEADEARLALQHFWYTGKRLAVDPDLAERTMRALGRHGHPDSFEVFARIEWVDEDEEPIRAELARAQVRGLGRIRELRSVERLIELFGETPELRRHELRADFRLALLVLTGEDEDSLNVWRRWWDNRPEDYELSEERPELGTHDALDWLNYFGLPLEVEMDEELKERRKRRRG